MTLFLVIPWPKTYAPYWQRQTAAAPSTGTAVIAALTETITPGEIDDMQQLPEHFAPLFEAGPTGESGEWRDSSGKSAGP